MRSEDVLTLGPATVVPLPVGIIGQQIFHTSVSANVIILLSVDGASLPPNLMIAEAGYGSSVAYTTSKFLRSDLGICTRHI